MEVLICLVPSSSVQHANLLSLNNVVLNPSYFSTPQLMTLQKVPLPTKPAVGASFQEVQTQKARGNCTAAGAKGLFERYLLSYGFGNMKVWFLHMYLLFEGEENSVCQKCSQFQPFIPALPHGTDWWDIQGVGKEG